MKTKHLVCIAVIAILIVSSFAAALAFSAREAEKPADYTWPVNQNGETYGYIYFDDEKGVQYNPDLERVGGAAIILADGSTDQETEGYIRRTEKDPYMGLEPPRSSEDALRYDHELLELAYNAKANGHDFVFYIPVYASDGVTIVGSYGIGRAEDIIVRLAGTAD